MSKKSIMVYSTPSWGSSSYAKIARNVIPLLQERGHDVANFAWNSMRGAVLDMGGTVIYPGGQTVTGRDVLAGHISHFDADILLVVADPWVMESPVHWRMGHDAKVIFWHPCQNDPPGEALLDYVGIGDLGLNYSQWGTKAMRRGGATNVEYCPLGVDTELFKPIKDSKKLLGERFGVEGFEERFVIGMIAANSSTLPLSRKGFDANLKAFRMFLDRVDESAIFYAHTDISGASRGMDLRPLLDDLELRLLEHVYHPSKWAYRTHIPDTELAIVYSGCDVITNATRGEGFGLPILEAQACGTPVVTTNWSSMPELTRYGICTEPATMEWICCPLDGWCAVPDPEAIFEAYVEIYKHWNDFKEFPGKEDGLELAQSLNWTTVVDEYLEPRLQ
jgi:glycosyltransferase involved in cell wall biosynthesis